MSPEESPTAAFPTPSHDDWLRAAEKALRGKPLDSLRSTTEDDIPVDAVVEAAEPVPIDRDRAGIAICASVFDFDGGDGLVHDVTGALESSVDLVHVRSSHLALATAMTELPGKRVLVSQQAAGGEAPVWFAAAARGDVAGVVGWDADSCESAVTQLAETMLMNLSTLDEVVAEGGVPATAAARALVIPIPVGPEVVAEVAKVRALRALWERVAEHVGIPPEDAAATRILATPADYHLTRFEPESNLLRCTLSAFAAVSGGADIVEVAPHFVSGGDAPDHDEGMRLAVNQMRLILQESHLGRVDDPFAGAPLVEALTARLVERGWDAMTELDQEPTEESLRDAERASVSAARRRLDAVARRKRTIVGINAFPDPSRDDQVASLDFSYGEDGLVDITYESLRESALLDAAQPFEWLRDRVLSHVRTGKRRPLVLIVGAGDVRAMRAASAYAADLFRCGGFDAESPDPGAAPADAAAAVTGRVFDALVVCGDDEVAAAVEAATDMPYYRVGKTATDSQRLIARLYAGIDAVEVLADALDRIGVSRAAPWHGHQDLDDEQRLADIADLGQWD